MGGLGRSRMQLYSSEVAAALIVTSVLLALGQVILGLCISLSDDSTMCSPSYGYINITMC